MATSETIWITATRRRFSTEAEAIAYEEEVQNSVETWIDTYIKNKINLTEEDKATLSTEIINNFSELRRAIE